MVTLTVDNKDYQLRLPTRQLVEIEKRLGGNIMNVFANVETNSLPEIGKLLIILHGSLQQLNHGITLEDVYDLYDKWLEEGGNLEKLVLLITDVLKDSKVIPDEQSKN